VTRACELALDTLRLEQDGRVLTAFFSDPPYNFMTAGLQRDLDLLVRAVDADPGVGAVVLTGGVEGRYITHFDISDILAAAEQGGSTPEAVIRGAMRGIRAAGRVTGSVQALEATRLAGLLNVTRFNEVVLRILRSPAVWIAAVDGPCGGGGLEMSVCFDVLLASDRAQFLLPELLIGLTTTVGAQRLVQLVGPARAMEVMLEGRAYTADEAERMGLLSAVVPDAAGGVLAEAQRRAARYATRPRPVVAAQKRVFYEYALLPPAESLLREGATNSAGIVNGVAPVALSAWVTSQDRHGGESVFLADPQPWVDGTAVDLNP
jgi:enoyl-CoA hydratase